MDASERQDEVWPVEGARSRRGGWTDESQSHAVLTACPHIQHIASTAGTQGTTIRHRDRQDIGDARDYEPHVAVRCGAVGTHGRMPGCVRVLQAV